MRARFVQNHGGGRRTLRSLLMVVVVTSLLTTAYVLTQPRSAKAAVLPANAVLLMVHGFDDTCDTAFNQYQDTLHTGISAGANPSTTLNYFNYGGWNRGQRKDQIQLVGYYAPDPNNSTTGEGACNVNLSIDSSFSKGGNYSGTQCDRFFNNAPNAPSSTYQGNSEWTYNDPIQHLGCVMAWYIQHFNFVGIPVAILAHSMGGLIVRDAIGESGTTPGFPTSRLNVTRVVTVGTPHGGESGAYLTLAHWRYNLQTPSVLTPREVWDMDPGPSGSGFMSILNQYQAPRGAGGTQWVLMAGSVGGMLSPVWIWPVDLAGCLINATFTSFISCFAEVTQQNNPYPDGDGVVQADSALSMQADVKILYGTLGYCNLATCTAETPGTSVNYSHESNTSQTVQTANGPKTVALAPEYLLNDATRTSSLTGAWVCSSNCINGGVGDLQPENSSHVKSIPHSLATILSYLPPPGDVYYATSNLGAANNIYALNAVTGQVAWSYPTTGFNGSTTLADGVVYAGSNGGGVYAVGDVSGNLAWHFPFSGNVQGPGVADGMVYFGGSDGSLYALDAISGALRWKSACLCKTKGGLFPVGVPSVANVTAFGGTVYVRANSNTVYAFDAISGTILWSYSTKSSLGDAVYANGMVYVTGNTNTSPQTNSLLALDATTGRLAWSFSYFDHTGFSYSLGGVTVANGVLYVGSADFWLHALNATTGAAVWNVPLGHPEVCGFLGTYTPDAPVVVNGTLYIGDLSEVDAYATSNGAQLWYYQPCFAFLDTPTVTSINGNLYGYSPDSIAGVTALNLLTGTLLWEGPGAPTGNGCAGCQTAGGLIAVGP